MKIRKLPRKSTKPSELLEDYLMKNSEAVAVSLVILLALGSVIINHLWNPTFYQNLMILIGGTQAIITGFLSFKIYSVSRRESELPFLDAKMTDVREHENPYDNFTVVECDVEITNLTHGRAKIKDVDHEAEWNERDLEKHKTQGEGTIVSSIKYKETPKILDKGDTTSITFQINGLQYCSSFKLIVEEAMKDRELDILISDISNRLFMKKGSSEDESSS